MAKNRVKKNKPIESQPLDEKPNEKGTWRRVIKKLGDYFD